LLAITHINYSSSLQLATTNYKYAYNSTHPNVQNQWNNHHLREKNIPPPSLGKKSYNPDSSMNDSNSFNLVNPSNSSSQETGDTSNLSIQ
jgi:hypothetical protein